MAEALEIVIPVAPKDLGRLGFSVSAIRRNLNPARIVVITAKAAQGDVLAIPGVDFLDEDAVVPGLSLAAVREAMDRRVPGAGRKAGWYLQQFLKMGYAGICRGGFYAVWDADTVPCRPVAFFGGGEKPFFSMKTERHTPYFKTMARLLPRTPKRGIKGSFIAEHMVFDKKIMLELVREIEANPDYSGPFWERIIAAVDAADLPGSGFSEFETYGHFAMTRFPGAYRQRTLKSFRRGGLFLDAADLETKTVDWLGRNFDTVSFENHHLSSAAARGRGAVWLYERRFRLPPGLYFRAALILRKLSGQAKGK